MTGTSHIRLDTSVQYVKGIGPKRADILAGADVRTVGDLLAYYPRRYIDRSTLKRISDLKPGDEATVVGRVFSSEIVRGRTKRFMLLVGDQSGFLHCVWFGGLPYIAKAFKAGDTVAFSGKVTFYRGPQLVHPEFDKISEEGENNPLHTGGIIPLYPSSEALSQAGLDSRGFRRILRPLLDSLESADDPLPREMLSSLDLMPLISALENVHFPNDWPSLNKARHRLKFDELFFIQLALGFGRAARLEENRGIAFNKPGGRMRDLLERLPFSLTAAQKRVMREIHDDMKSERSMNRLLQGDVGSGKTIIALLSMLVAVENGYQAALMAPTEILAEQHFLTVHSMLEELGIRIVLLKGGQKGSDRKRVLEAIGSGDADIAVGTHALVEEGVAFHRLGFVVIDEQHRFGVLQRAELRQKGYFPDVLVMTATPIPRTLALTLYGDLDVSVLDEMPAGRLPVRTVWRTEEKREAIYGFIRDEVRKGRQAYIVYPLVEESEKVDLAAATEGYADLSKSVFPEFKTALLHGRMKPDEKESVMGSFKSNGIQILVSTTVIEVGVDVPNASVMLVEHAERYGLTQLHQLRGRVGRGKDQSACILVAQHPLSDDAKKRLEIMVSTNDGFKIAEADLEIRGPGELLGTRQHGIAGLKIANLLTDGRILDAARKEAFSMIETDRNLSRPENRTIREALKKKMHGNFGLIRVG
jgi:ATP-dependent DNA helicase RecG